MIDNMIGHILIIFFGGLLGIGLITWDFWSNLWENLSGMPWYGLLVFFGVFFGTLFHSNEEKA